MCYCVWIMYVHTSKSHMGIKHDFINQTSCTFCCRSCQTQVCQRKVEQYLNCVRWHAVPFSLQMSFMRRGSSVAQRQLCVLQPVFHRLFWAVCVSSSKASITEMKAVLRLISSDLFEHQGERFRDKTIVPFVGTVAVNRGSLAGAVCVFSNFSKLYKVHVLF